MMKNLSLVPQILATFLSLEVLIGGVDLLFRHRHSSAGHLSLKISMPVEIAECRSGGCAVGAGEKVEGAGPFDGDQPAGGVAVQKLKVTRKELARLVHVAFC